MAIVADRIEERHNRAAHVDIIPVIDIKNGIVVRGVAGERDTYRPVESCLTEGHTVVEVAEAIRSAFALNRLYVADLDAILEQRPHDDLYRDLLNRGFDLIVDAGLRNADDARRLADCGVPHIVAGLETMPSPALLSQLVEAVGSERLIFSLDLHDGEPLVSAEHRVNWSINALINAGFAFEFGVRRMIVLDLAAVGVGSGPATLPLCGKIRERFPDVELITGGGIRGIDDLQQLQSAGIDGVLIASALHNGGITRDDLRHLTFVQSDESATKEN